MFCIVVQPYLLINHLLINKLLTSIKNHNKNAWFKHVSLFMKTNFKKHLYETLRTQFEYIFKNKYFYFFRIRYVLSVKKRYVAKDAE